MSKALSWDELPPVRRARRDRRRRWLPWAAGAAAALGAALPGLLAGAPPPPGTPAAQVVVCLDVSRSMLARDLRPSRLERARQEVRELTAAAAGARLGLVACAGEARLLVPLTADLDTFAGLVDLAGPESVPRGGTDLGAALETALEALEEAGALAGFPDARPPAAIFLLSDGEDLGGRGAELAARCREVGVAVHCLGLGSPLGAKIPVPGEGGEVFLRDREGREVVTALDSAGLQAVARATGGSFRVATGEAGVLPALYREEIRPLPARPGDAGGRALLARLALLLALGAWMLDLLLARGWRT